MAVPVSLLLILFLLYAAFNSLGPGLIIFSAIPLSAIGGIMALWIRGMPFSISAGIGFIALFGVSVLNGIVLLTEIRRLNLQEGLDLKNSIMEGCVSRLRPVLMTAAVASFGFLPMALSQRAGAEVQRPLASVVIAGLVSSTILTLFVLPVLYQWMEKRRLKKAAVLPMVLLALLPMGSRAQAIEKATLEEAITRVRQINPQLVMLGLKAEYSDAMRGTAGAIPKTFAEVEAGENEGPNFDFRFSATQSFQPMGLAGKRKDYFKAEMEAAKANGAVLQRDIDLLVKSLFNQYGAGKAEMEVYKQLDTLISTSVAVARKRLLAGETDKLEVTNLELMAAQLEQGRISAQNALSGLEATLGIMLQQKAPVVPITNWEPSNYEPNFDDSSLLAGHPLMEARNKEFRAAKAFTLTEKAQNNLEWQVGINNISVTGWQTSKDQLSETYYGIGNRFWSGMVGASIPIFNKAGRSRVAAAGIQEKMAGKMIEAEWQQLRLQYAQAISKWKALQQQIKAYEQTTLPLSEALIETAQRRFKAGSIHYLEWGLAIQQAMQARLQYVQLRREFESKVIDLQYFNER